MDAATSAANIEVRMFREKLMRLAIAAIFLFVPSIALADWWQGTFVLEGQDLSAACKSSTYEWFGVIEIGKDHATYADDTHCTFQAVEPVIGLDAVILSERCEGFDGDPVTFRRAIIMSRSQMSHERDVAGIILYPTGSSFDRCRE